MESQEYFTWEEGPELTLFGGEELLMSLGSPLEPDALPPVLYSAKGAVSALDSLPTSTRAEGCTSLQPPAHTVSGGPPKVLSDDWLDTQLDLHNLLQAPEPLQFSQELPEQSPVSYPSSPTCSALELLDSMSLASSLAPPLDLDPTPLDLSSLEGPDQYCSQLLAEVLSKLTEYVGQDIPADGSAMPSLNDQSTLSPVSVGDIESLLSDPSSPCAQAVPSEGPSELELLLTSGQVTPLSQHSSGQVTPSSLASTSFSAASSDIESDYVPTRESRSKKQRVKPYSRERQPSDMKARKKVQNKTAALKYRQKKRGETDTMFSECDVLEERNKHLKDKVETMTREIQYLKDLMAEVLIARQANTN